jgi:FtsP/CotA-like multicopper oxidase with cupredoxin domain
MFHPCRLVSERHLTLFFMFYRFYTLVVALWLMTTVAYSATKDYALAIEEKTIALGGRDRRALTINGQSPGPTLEFTEGDTARITVTNLIPGDETSIHWHGLLVPNFEDGVPYISTPAIPSGRRLTYEFPLRHAGTYWYHSHTGFQKQRGLFGSIIVHPRRGERHRVDRDVVLVLSDWTDDDPQSVMRTLMRGSDWYAIKKGTAQSIFGAYQHGHLREYFDREKARLPAMDVADVAYDAFLINGQRRSQLTARAGEKIRLRVINAAASTYFYLHSASGPLRLIAADGIDIAPISQQRLLIGMAETYDLLYTVPASGAWELRATAQDHSGSASLFIGTGSEKIAPDLAPLNAYSMNESLSTILDQIDATPPPNDREALKNEPPRPLPPYARLRSLKPTTLPAAAPVRREQIILNGDMRRYVWTMNGTTLSEKSTIPVKKGEILQLEFRNDSMMHHPMHLHGHFFRVLMDNGPDQRYAPLKHTIDVPPMSKRVIEFYADEEKDWAFHCHLLYHMHSGMMKVLSYDGQGSDHLPRLDPRDDNPFYFMFQTDVQTHMNEGHAMFMDEKNDFGLRWHLGYGHDFQPHTEEHLSHDSHEHRHDKVEYEADLLWQRYLDPHWQIYAAWRLTNHLSDDEEREKNSAVLGVKYLLPYFVESELSVESTGDVRLSLAKRFQLTDRLSLRGQIQYDTSEALDWMVGLHYTLNRRWGLITSYDSDHGPGAGLSFTF